MLLIPLTLSILICNMKQIIAVSFIGLLFAGGREIK